MADWDQPGEPKHEDRVSFGPGETDNMPSAWASLALTWLKKAQPHIFGQMMTEGVWGIEKQRRNGRGT